ncbi:MAG: hypothetical protein IJJ31_06890 [Mogibacterium sp.]|nr:hypothetical protein [Mogibacterium sp.]
MDKTALYLKLDIESPEEFKFYENLAALLEEDDYIEENLIRDLIKDIDKEVLAEHLDSFFEQFLANLPDNETELYITVDSIGRAMSGMISPDMSAEDIHALSSEIARFRKWYVHDLNVFDKLNAAEISLRDARYNILAAGFLGEPYDYDFRTALDYDLDGYDVRISDIIY